MLYFHNEKNLKTINLLREEREKFLLEKQKEGTKEPKLLLKKLEELLEVGNNIPLNTAADYLQIELDFFFKNLTNWARDLNFRIENNFIIKKNKSNSN